MVITKKDKKLILFILSLAIVFWFFYLSISSLFTKIIFYNSNIKNITNHKAEWLNVERPLEASDIKNRVILLDFWTYACVNCLHVMPEIKKLEQEFGNKLTVVGVHSGKFNNEKKIDGIRKAVLKHDISHPVVNDADFKIWKSFGVKSWPTMILLDPNGRITKTYEGEVSGSIIREDVKKLVKKYKYNLSHSALPIVLEKNKMVNYVLKFPAKIKFARDFSYKNISKTNALIISNTGKNNIMITSLNGKSLLEIGSGSVGFEDGDFNTASFNSPRGLLFKNNILYVADTGNQALRKIDFTTGKVQTIAGNGSRGDVVKGNKSAKNTSLASPWDLEFFPDNNNIIIANAGTHQLLRYNLSAQTISPFAGNGEEGLTDGKYPHNALAQPSGLSAANGKLYFVDSESSSLRVAQKDGEVDTLIGKGLFDFGHQNGGRKSALLQHPVGLTADDIGVYIADTHNHIIRKYNFNSKELTDYSGSVRGDGVGSKNNTSYNEPEAIISILDKFYIADTNNNRIVELSNNGSSKFLDVIPKLKMPKDGLLEYLPNLEKIAAQTVKSNSEITLLFNMKKGWKINESAPSFFNLIEINSHNEANLIASFDWEMIKSGTVKLPKLSSKYKYLLQGTVYYCKDKKNALCLVKSYEQKLVAQQFASDKMEIQFIYR